MSSEDEPPDSALITAVTTEHFTLQTARSAVISDSSSRTNQFLTTVSAALVALALVAQVSSLGTAFYGFALTILPVLVFLGVATMVRVVQLSIEDQLYGLAIARIRSYYAAVAGPRNHLLLLAQARDAGERADAALADLGSRQAVIQTVVATPGSVAVVTAVLLGATIALTVHARGATLTVALTAGSVGTLVALGVLLGWTARIFGRAQQGLTRLTAGKPTSGGR